MLGTIDLSVAMGPQTSTRSPAWVSLAIEKRPVSERILMIWSVGLVLPLCLSFVCTFRTSTLSANWMSTTGPLTSAQFAVLYLREVAVLSAIFIHPPYKWNLVFL